VTFLTDRKNTQFVDGEYRYGTRFVTNDTFGITDTVNLCLISYPLVYFNHSLSRTHLYRVWLHCIPCN